MPVPQNSTMTTYFQHITDITGIDFKSGTPEEISRALSSIYIDGHSVLELLGAPSISGTEDKKIKEVSDMLDQALSATDDEYSFVSVMNHDDPFAKPRMISNDTLLDVKGNVLNTDAMDEVQSAKIIDTFEKKKEAAKAYAENYSVDHEKNLASLNHELADENAFAAYHKIDNFLSTAVYDPKKNTLVPNELMPSAKRDMNSVLDMCNLVLLNRGYTMEELSGDGVNIKEGREKVGKMMEQILFDYGMIPVDRAKAFLGLVDEAATALEEMQMKRVDLSDDSTFSNVMFNRQVAEMASSLQKMIGYARDNVYDDRLDQSADRVRTITNFTDGVMKLDTARIAAAQPGADYSTVAEGMTAQAFVDTLGPDYIKFRSTTIVGVKNELSMTDALDSAIDRASGYDNGRISEAYKDAYDQLSWGDATKYKDIVTEQVKNNEKLAQAVHNTVESREGRYLIHSEEASLFTPQEGETFVDYKTALGQYIKGSTSQLDRVTTTGVLIAIFAAWDAEQNGREFSVDDYLHNKDMQREMGAKTLEFFREHPIPAATDEATVENVRLFGKMSAAFNRKLDDVVVPQLDTSSPEASREQVNYLNTLMSMFQDVEQLRALVPNTDPKFAEAFYEAEGGFDNYTRTSEIRDAAMGVMHTERYYLKHAAGLADKSIDHLMDSPKGFNMTSLTAAVYVLNHDGKKFMGKKVSECTDDFGYLNYLRSAADTGFDGQLKPRRIVGNDRDKQKMLVDYVTSMGRDDKLDLNTSMRDYRESFMKLYEVREENRESYQEEFEMLQQEEEVFEVDPYQEINEIVGGNAHDWSKELSRKDWKARITEMEKLMSANDPALLRSSPEYKAVREGLKQARIALEAETKQGAFDVYSFNDGMRKVFQNAGDYIQKKENSGKLGEKYGQKRLDAMRDLRGMLSKRNSTLTPEDGVALLFGSDGDLDNYRIIEGFIRLGGYLEDALELKETDPEKSKQMIDLVDRVLEERGKNYSTRKELMNELDKHTHEFFAMNVERNEDEYVEALCNAKKSIVNVMKDKMAMTEKAANWFGVMNVYAKLAETSTNDKFKKSGTTEAVREMAMCGRLAERAIQTRYKAMDFDAPEMLTKKEATELVTFSTLGEFMLHRNKADHVKVFKSIMKSNGSEEELLKSFEDLEAVQHLCKVTGKDSIRQISSRHAQEEQGKLGKIQFCNKLKLANEALKKDLDKAMENPAAFKGLGQKAPEPKKQQPVMGGH